MQTLLVEEYLSRKQKNRSYSERAFAKSLGLSPGFLKLYFQGKRSLSAKRAKIVANRLGWSEHKAGNFLRETQEKKGNSARRLPAESFAEISDWYHFAILELLKISKDITRPEIAKRLKISAAEVDYSLHLLEEKELIKRKNGKISVEKNYIVPAASSSAIRKFHRQCLSKAISSIEEQGLEERLLRSLTLAFDRSRMEEATAFIKKFTAQFEKKFGTGNPDRIYQMSLAFFALDKE